METWEFNPAFRQLVEQERQAGRLHPDEAAAIAALPRQLEERHADDAVLVARLARAQALFAASGVTDRDDVFARWKIPARGSTASRGCPGPPKR